MRPMGGSGKGTSSRISHCPALALNCHAMKIRVTTWNIDRAHERQKWRMPEQQRLIESQNADLHVVTEVSDRLLLHGKPAVHFSDPGEPPSYETYEHACG